MTAGELLSLGVLALVIGAIWLGRRRGRAAFAAAVAEAHAAGFAEASASANSAAVASGGHVVLNVGQRNDSTGYDYDHLDGRADDYDALAEWFRVRELRRLHDGHADARPVGELLGGVHGGQAPADGDALYVRRADAADGARATYVAQDVTGRHTVTYTDDANYDGIPGPVLRGWVKR